MTLIFDEGAGVTVRHKDYERSAAAA
jgi:hypothetical protein